MSAKTLIAAVAALLLFPALAHGQTLSELHGRYAILPSSHVSFFVGQVGGGGISGVFTRFSGSFELVPRDVARSGVAFSLEPASVTTGQPRVDGFLRSSAVFDVERHPVIIFRSVRVIQDGPQTARIEGLLSARGIERRESFRARLVERRGRQVAFHVTGDVLRSPYGMDVGTPIYSNVVHFDMVLQGDRK